jgi:lipopolysaccharide transport system ATP-binding protein
VKNNNFVSGQETSDLSPATDLGEVLVRVEGVSKKFCRSLKRSLWYGLCDIGAELNPFAKQRATSREQGARYIAEERRNQLATSNSLTVTSPPLRPDEFWAVSDVSFELRRGECLGLIGHNGAGKTTLLKMLNGLIKPDRGRIDMNGRVGALIALGAGFNPILTGRENIYINGSVLGLSNQEIDARLPDIVSFAGVGDFLDMPVQNYSSGMQVRLGFAVATTLEPDILILDEVLAVGDAAFRAKCYERIDRLRSRAAVIFVSHSMDQIAHVCTKVCAMNKGNANFFHDAESGTTWLEDHRSPAELSAEKTELLAGNIASFTCDSEPSAVIGYGECLRLNLAIVALSYIQKAHTRIILYSGDGSIAAEWSTLTNNRRITLQQGPNKISIKLGPLHLRAGTYTISILLFDSASKEKLVWAHHCHQFVLKGSILGKSCYILP